MRQLLRRAWYLLRRRQFERDLREELEFHRAMKQRELEDAGHTLGDATIASRRALGSVALAQDQVRDVWIRPWLDALVRDVRFGVRLLQKNPGFAAIAILTLAVAIGANTAVFTLVDHLLLRPLPYAEPHRLATVVRHYARGTTSGEGYAQNGATWFALQEGVSGLDWASTGVAGGVNLVAGNQVAYVQQHKVSAGLFRVLAVPPALGREFRADEDREGGPAVVVLSHQLWVRVFGSDVHIIGRSITLRGEPFIVVGVMPAGFHPLTPADLWTPLRPSRQGEGNGQNYLFVARLRPGVRWSDASGQVESIGSALLREMFKPPPDLRLSMHLVPFRDSVTSNIREPLILLWASVGVLLLIGCVNIAALLFVRASVRAPEIATRIALGGGRATIVRQLLAESLVLAATGGLAGIGLGYALSGAISVRLQDIISLPTRPDLRVLVITTASSLLTSLLFGLFPAYHASRTDVRGMLIESGGKAIAGPASRWPARALVAAEVALGLVLLVGAGLLVRTFAYLTQLRPGFDATHVITGTASLQDARYQTAMKVNDLFARSLEGLQRAPGVERAAVALTLPYERALNFGWRFDGDAGVREEPISLTYVTAAYFSTLRIPVRRGRVFTDHDTTASPPVAVVNDAFVRRYTSEIDPIGRRVLWGAGRSGVEIVGVVGNIQQQVPFGNLGPVTTFPAAYVPVSQFGDANFTLAHTWFEPSWIVRTTGASPSIVDTMQHALREVDPQLPFNKFRTLDDVRGDAVMVARIEALLLAAFAATALLLCALGVYGLVAQSVVERRRELGVRIALGATPATVLRTAITSGVAMALVGAVLGLVLAAGVARVMQGLVFGVAVRDPLTFAGATALVILTACAASIIPAVRTLRLNVATVLNA